MAAHKDPVFALWPVSERHKDETSFVVVPDGEKGFLRIYPEGKPGDAVVIPESVIARMVFLAKSDNTFGRHRVLIFFEQPQLWPFYGVNFRTRFIVFYCRAGDTHITEEQQQQVAEQLAEYERTLAEDDDAVDDSSDDDNDAPPAKRQKALTGEHKKRSDVMNESISVIVQQMGVELFETIYAENVNNYISDLYQSLCDAFTSIQYHTVDPDDESAFFTTFDSNGKRLHCCTSTDRKIMLIIEAVILCSSVLCIRLDCLAASVFHQDLNGSHHLQGESPIKIYFVPNHDGSIHMFSNFSEQCAENLLHFMQELDGCNVVYTTVSGRTIDPSELDPLRKLTADDIEAMWSRQEPANPAQRCCAAIGMQIQDPEPEGDGTIESDDDEDQPEWQQESEDEDYEP
jgi:hypothetical protein